MISRQFGKSKGKLIALLVCSWYVYLVSYCPQNRPGFEILATSWQLLQSNIQWVDVSLIIVWMFTCYFCFMYASVSVFTVTLQPCNHIERISNKQTDDFLFHSLFQFLICKSFYSLELCIQVARISRMTRLAFVKPNTWWPSGVMMHHELCCGNFL